MRLTIEQVHHIANLARLELTDEEISRYRDQLSAILAHFEHLQAVNTADLPESEIQAIQSVLRRDEVAPGLSLDQVLSNAPETDADQFKVPPVFE
jgi:aspartyl-tRNA(Asn)/glutamyl-tRNA(Gln) amidotransferase subunit C